jgi:hypothetical protein
MSKRLTGLNPLAYMGVEPEMPPNMYMSPNAPTPTDVFNFNLGDFWVDTTTQQLWVLVSQQKGVAKWITLFGGASDVFVTDAGTATPAAGVINVNGDGLNILTSGAGNTVTIHMNPDPTFGTVTLTGLTFTGFTGGVLVSNGAGDISEVTTTNHSLLIGNASGTISSLGVATNGQIPIGSTGVDPVLNTITAGTGITVTNGAGTITIASTGAGLTFDGNTGSATESGGIINIVGTGGLSTTASGNTVTINGGGNVPISLQFTLTSTQIKNLATTPLQVIAAQGANKLIIIRNVDMSFVYGGHNAFTNVSNIDLYYVTNLTANFAGGAVGSTQLISGTNNAYQVNLVGNSSSLLTASNMVNQPIVVGVDSMNTNITGNAANDNSIVFVVNYEVVDVTTYF